jgi:hypothetical protein
MLDSFLSDLKRWAALPYKEDGNIGDWILFLGFMVAVTFIWTRIIARIID